MYRSSISSVNANEHNSSVLVTELCQQLRACEDKLKSIERLNGINQRWSIASTQYCEVKALLSSEKRARLLLKLEHTARERWFLLTLKGKYAGTVHIIINFYHHVCVPCTIL